MERFFATCPRGLELLLAAELRQFKAEHIHAVGGGVQFVGDFLLCYRVNLESRIASRVLWQLAAGVYRSEDDIYRIVHALRWTGWIDPADTIPVPVSAIKSPHGNTKFVPLTSQDDFCQT